MSGLPPDNCSPSFTFWYALSPNDTADTRTDAIIAALKKQEGQTGVVATKKDNTLSFTTNDGRNLSIWMDAQTDSNAGSLTPEMFGLKSADVAVRTPGTPDAWDHAVKTYYGTVEMANAGFTENYSNSVKRVTFTVRWTNGIARSQTMSTYVSQYGIQNYIY